MKAPCQLDRQWSAALVFCNVVKFDAESQNQWQLDHASKKVHLWNELFKIFDEQNRELYSRAIRIFPQAKKLCDQREVCINLSQL